VSGAKTEEPTPRRLRKAREEGDTGASAFAAQAIALVAAALLLPAAVSVVALRVEDRLRDAIHRVGSADPTVTPAVDIARAAKDVAQLSLPFLAGMAFVTAASTLVQTGGLAGMSRFSPRLARLNPFARGLVTGARLFTAARALVGAVLVAWIAAHELRAHAADIARTSGRLVFAAPAAAAVARTTAWEVALAGLAIGVVDVVVVRAARRRRLRMSRDDVKRERKEAEGDPLLKDERERARGAMVAAGELAGVRTARVVVRDGDRAACALRYDDDDEAPVVVASRSARDGDGVEGLVREARAHGVAVVESAEVARALATARAGEAIPEGLYDAVAEILRGE
jgi:flagellar biosynthesis protein FlhB